MKTIYILFTRPNTVLSTIVHWVTDDAYTHLSIAFDENMYELYSSTRKNGQTLFPAGPCKEYLYGKHFEKRLQSPCAIYELKVSDEVYDKAREEIEKIIDEIDKYHFNIIGLILCKFGITYRRKRHFFCAQFVGEILTRSGACELPRDTSVMRPIDYLQLPEINCYYRGKVYDFVYNYSRCKTGA